MVLPFGVFFFCLFVCLTREDGEMAKRFQLPTNKNGPQDIMSEFWTFPCVIALCIFGDFFTGSVCLDAWCEFYKARKLLGNRNF